MDFQTPVQQKCYERITPMIKELFGEAFVNPEENFPFFWLSMGSSIVRVIVSPFGDDEATIQIYSIVVSGAEGTPDLMKYLLNENANMRFGAFAIDSDGDIIFQHTIIGDTCDKAELKASILAVLHTADNEDDEIVAKFGGQRAIDRKPS